MERNYTPTLDIPLDLKLSDIQVPDVMNENIPLPEEVNEFLRDQLSKYRSENAVLRKELEESKKSTINLQSSMKMKANPAGDDFHSASQVATTKITELSKKLREKSAEVEVFRSKCAKIEKQLREVEEIAAKSEPKEVTIEAPPQDELKRLQDKLSALKSRWAEEKNANLKLKNDLKMANKWLQQEIGDSFENLNSLNSTSNWRGRAQIIQDLQQKVQELREKLKILQDKNSPGKLENLSPGKVDKKLEIFSRENHELRNNLDDLKRKYDANKARCKSLEMEICTLKKKLAENSERDQQLIASLTEQISGKKQEECEELKQKDLLLRKLQQQYENLRVELEKEKCASENKSRILNEKNDDIAILNKRIRSARPQSSYTHKVDKIEAQKPRVFDEETKRLEAEKIRLLELTEIQNRRLEEERNSHMKTQNILRIEKQKGARLEANLARLELEQTSARSCYSSGSKTSLNSSSKSEDLTLKDKLELAEEGIKALSNRLELEIIERRNDLQEFTKMLKNYTCENL